MLNKNIAIVLNTAWNVYNFRLGLIRKLRDEGYNVIVIAPYDDFVIKIKNERFKFIPLKNLSRKGTNPINDLKLIIELYNIYRLEKIDVTLQYTIKPVIYGTLAAKLANVKSLNTLTGLGFSFLSDGLINYLVKRLYKFSLNSADIVWFQNEDDKALFVDTKLVNPNKVDIVNGSGIDTGYFCPSIAYIGNTPLIFLFIGRLLFDKGIQEYVDAARIIKAKGMDAEFHIVGALDIDNPSAIDKTSLDKWINEGVVCYCGETTDVRSFIQKSDVIVLPSYREGLPRVMLEGMSMGKPLITTDVPGCRATVKDNHNGFLAEVKNAKSLANAIEKMLLLTSKEREQMGKIGREMALAKFDERIIIKKYVSELSKFLSFGHHWEIVK